ncbi:hypothetical protein TH2_132 [Shewanella phage Thanatos-2]|nr:hypothetical protein TH2_132 [Shewanella phage Thanatos-2]
MCYCNPSIRSIRCNSINCVPASQKERETLARIEQDRLKVERADRIKTVQRFLSFVCLETQGKGGTSTKLEALMRDYFEEA